MTDGGIQIHPARETYWPGETVELIVENATAGGTVEVQVKSTSGKFVFNGSGAVDESGRSVIDYAVPATDSTEAGLYHAIATDTTTGVSCAYWTWFFVQS